MRTFKCAKIADCMYKITTGRCSRAPRLVAIDRHCHYGNQSNPDAQYPILVDLHGCPYRGAEVRDMPNLKVEAEVW